MGSSSVSKKMHQVMGAEYAELFQLLGIQSPVELSELNKKYKKYVKNNHPDRGGDGNKFSKANSTYTSLKDVLSEDCEQIELVEEDELTTLFAKTFGHLSPEDFSNAMQEMQAFVENFTQERSHERAKIDAEIAQWNLNSIEKRLSNINDLLINLDQLAIDGMQMKKAVEATYSSLHSIHALNFRKNQSLDLQRACVETQAMSITNRCEWLKRDFRQIESQLEALGRQKVHGDLEVQVLIEQKNQELKDLCNAYLQKAPEILAIWEELACQNEKNAEIIAKVSHEIGAETVSQLETMVEQDISEAQASEQDKISVASSSSSSSELDSDPIVEDLDQVRKNMQSWFIRTVAKDQSFVQHVIRWYRLHETKPYVNTREVPNENEMLNMLMLYIQHFESRHRHADSIWFRWAYRLMDNMSTAEDMADSLLLWLTLDDAFEKEQHEVSSEYLSEQETKDANQVLNSVRQPFHTTTINILTHQLKLPSGDSYSPPVISLLQTLHKTRSWFHSFRKETRKVWQQLRGTVDISSLVRMRNRQPEESESIASSKSATSSEESIIASTAIESISVNTFEVFEVLLKYKIQIQKQLYNLQNIPKELENEISKAGISATYYAYLTPLFSETISNSDVPSNKVALDYLYLRRLSESVEGLLDVLESPADKQQEHWELASQQLLKTLSEGLTLLHINNSMLSDSIEAQIKAVIFSLSGYLKDHQDKCCFSTSALLKGLEILAEPVPSWRKIQLQWLAFEKFPDIQKIMDVAKKWLEDSCNTHKKAMVLTAMDSAAKGFHDALYTWEISASEKALLIMNNSLKQLKHLTGQEAIVAEASSSQPQVAMFPKTNWRQQHEKMLITTHQKMQHIYRRLQALDKATLDEIKPAWTNLSQSYHEASNARNQVEAVQSQRLLEKQLKVIIAALAEVKHEKTFNSNGARVRL